MRPADEPEPSAEVLKQRERWFWSYMQALEERSVTAPLGDGPYRCPCCGCLTLGERGGYDICEVCFWEDDGQDDPYADEYRGGPNPCSLTEARANYARIGASHPRGLPHVRPPLPHEL